jgi:hypothetical protein
MTTETAGGTSVARRQEGLIYINDSLLSSIVETSCILAESSTY